MAGDFVTRTWSPGAGAPASESKAFDGELVLDRALLGVTDGSVSRAENAPRIRARTLVSFDVEVPERSAHPVVAIEGIRFEGLQHGVPPAGEEWKVSPGELSRRGRLVTGEKVSLALVRQLAWDRPGATHHLVLLPRAVKIQKGETRMLTAPAVIVVGQAAVDVTPSDTWVPAGMPRDTEGTTRSFRLGELESSLKTSEGLEKFSVVAPRGKLRVPGYDAELGAVELYVAAKSLLQGSDDYRFVPVLEDEKRALLGLAYRRADGSVGMIVSGGDPAEFLQRLTAFVQGAQRGPASAVSGVRGHAPAPREPVARFGAVETRSRAFAKVLEELAKVASTDIGILFLGESGTGKEHLARAVHQASPRASRPFVAVNCSALSAELIESELFGHKRGAFTGAHGDRDGAFVGADGGTLLLDEIGDAPPRVQVALLRALETRRVKPVGSDTERSVDVRVLAATSRDVRAMMESGDFREDLYYRLAEESVSLPPLRQRPEDIPALAALLLTSLAPNLRLSTQAELALTQNPWPGNVRELKNALKRAVALAGNTTIIQAIHLAPLGDMSSLTDPPPADVAIVYPPHVVAHADILWSGERSTLEDVTKYELRALQRAALLHLKERAPLDSWPKPLLQLWQRLFGARWASSEDGRGLRELVRELGLDPRDEGVRERVQRAVEN